MPCIQAQYGTATTGPCERCPSELLSPEGGRYPMEVPGADPTAAPALPSFSTFMESYAGELDAFLCQLPAGGQHAAFRLEELQVYGCYPAAVGQHEETLSSSSSSSSSLSFQIGLSLSPRWAVPAPSAGRGAALSAGQAREVNRTEGLEGTLSPPCTLLR